jgi:hypothetical protein
MALVRSVLVLIGVAALSSSAWAAEASRVTALSACPSGVDGCVEMILHWDYARTDKPLFVRGRSDALAVRGRLGAARVRAYELLVSRLETSGKDDLAVVAYLGRARDGRPIVVTDRGSFAIETRGLVVGRGDAVVIVDTREAKIVRSFLGGLGGGAYVVRGLGQIAVLSKSGACISPPSTRPGILEVASGCEERRAPPAGLAFSERLIGAIDAAPGADLALVRKLLPQTRDLDDAQLRAKIGRIDERHIVVTPWGD